jgi:molecular chaperone GrpE
MSQESAQSTVAPEPGTTTGEAVEPVPAAATEESVAAAPESATPEPSTREPTQTSPEELLARLTAASAEAEGLRDQLLRSRAEIENVRRRHANELEKAHKFALDGFVRELLQVRDSLELGREAALDAAADVAKLREGTELTLKLLGDVMERFGVAVVDPLDQPFDPTYHQAISTQPRADVPPNMVVTVVQKGYTLNGRLVRPALVLVSQQAS